MLAAGQQHPRPQRVVSPGQLREGHRRAHPSLSRAWEALSLLARGKRSWAELKNGQPGKRFQKRYERKAEDGRTAARKPLLIGAGLVVLVVGIFFLPAPGPGIIIVAIGAAMLAEQSLIAARMLDWSELRAREVMERAVAVWERSSPVARGAIVLLGGALAAAGAYAAWQMTFGRRGR
ncbi:MAG: hypothetical protein EXR95_01215 [Gemmatimonadetes bacterium]|nr:hypothetical protein [Gemmatimonadota bacterium]